MSAKEMFEELGYEHSIEQDSAGYFTDAMCDRWIMYSKEDIIIYFELYGNSFCKQERYLKYNVDISLKEFKAIQKQIEELGW